MATDQFRKFGSALPGAAELRAATKASPRLSRNVQAQIGQRLRAFYDALALGEQPVPDRFIEIIGRLEHPEKQQ
jgi:hypothetical protein